jgi:dienelactone hydrolase
MSMPYILESITKACVSKEFTILALNRTSPITTWLRALARAEHERCGGPGVGAVGMCLTGGFALAMMVDEVVVAPVLSQPSLPFPVNVAHRRALGISDADVERVKERVAAGVCVLGLRFTGDKASPPERFAALRELLGDGFVGVELDSSPGNPHGHRKGAHSVLTEDLDDRPGTPTRDALDQVLDLFRTRLLG